MARQKRAIHEIDEEIIKGNTTNKDGTIKGNETRYIFAKRLNKTLVEKKITQEQLCEETGISTGALSAYRNGTKEPRITNLYAISKYLDVSSDYFLGLSEESTTDPEIQEVCKFTGLSAMAVEILRDREKYGYECKYELVNMLIEDSESFDHYMEKFNEKKLYNREFKSIDDEYDESHSELLFAFFNFIYETPNSEALLIKEEDENVHRKFKDFNEAIELEETARLFILFKRLLKFKQIIYNKSKRKV